MTNWEAIAAAAVAIFGAWVFWPCLLVGGLLTTFGCVLGVAYAHDMWLVWRSRRRDAQKKRGV